MSILQAIILSIVEGLTEYLPISSTAHMIFTGELLRIDLEDNFVKMFTYCIQFGAILAVVTLYWKKFFNFKRIDFYLKLAFAVLPALILGKLLNEKIDQVLESPVVIAVVLVIGGVIFLFIDKSFNNQLIDSEDKISIKKAVIIGFWQCLAMMPGTSRSAASIIGGMQQNLTRQTAAEFSFFLAVPTMLAVTVYSLILKKWHQGDVDIRGYELLMHNGDKMGMFILGNVIAYIVSIFAIRFFVGIIKKYGFKIWGYYRIIVGSLLLMYFYFFK